MTERDESIDEILGDFLQKREAGETVDAAALIDAHPEHAGEIREFLGDLAHMQGVTGDASGEQPGAQIGPYKLREKIGEGGFGVVYLAEQIEPVRRRVALKVIKPGMDTGQVIGRFEAERQALALMDHPNISSVLDAGATESGRPYFVMELIKGIPISEYCDQCRLPTRDRLELFRTVCQAVQHAHQKGIIHRDIKPSNVLVAIHEGRPVPKIIDFGVAKAINQRLTEHSVMTGFAQMLGTPLYMSPEQAEMSPLDVDTRSDIFSLGVLLYELLTGTTPISKQEAHSASYDEIRRRIREEEPQRPSARISTLDAAASTVADQRRTEPRRLIRMYRGDLDWIVMKALEKDRTRRYATASGFAEDISRYLSDEPVLASPPSTAYRLRKFVRRNTAALATGIAMAALLIAGTVTSTLLAFRATEAEQLAEERFESEKEANRLSDAARTRDDARRSRINGRLHDVLSQLSELERQAESPAEDAEPISAQIRGLLGEADALANSDVADQTLVVRVQTLRDALLEAEKDREALRLLAHARGGANPEAAYLRPAGKFAVTVAPSDIIVINQAFENALAVYGIDPDTMGAVEAADIIRHRPKDVQAAIIAGLDEWMANPSRSNAERKEWLMAVVQAADDDPWRVRLREAIDRGDGAALSELVESKELESQPPYTWQMLWLALGRERSSERSREASIARAHDLLVRAQQRYPDDFELNARLISGPYLQGDFSEALRYATAAAALRPNDRNVLHNLGIILEELGRYQEAARVYLQVARLYRRMDDLMRLGQTLETEDRWELAADVYGEAFDAFPYNAEVALRYGTTLITIDRHIQAEPVLRMAVLNSEAMLADTFQQTASMPFRKAAYDRLIKAYGQFIACLRKLGRNADIESIEQLAGQLQAVDLPSLGENPRSDLALACARRSMILDPQGGHARALLGNALSDDKPGEAISAYREAIEFGLPPTSAAACRRSIAFMLFKLGQPEQAEAVLLEALEHLTNEATSERELINQSRAETMLTLGKLLAQRRPDEAIQWVEQAARLQPVNSLYWLHLAQLNLTEERWSQAAEAARRALAIDFRTDAAWALTRAEWKLGNVEKARRYYELARQQGRTAGFAERVELGKELGAEKPADIALDLIIQQFNSHRGLPVFVHADHEHVNLKAAIDLLTEAEEGESDPAFKSKSRQLRTACEGLVARLADKDRPPPDVHSDEAVAVLRSVIALQPERGFATSLLADALLTREQFQEALITLEALLEIQPSNHSARLQLAVVLTRQGRHEKAIDEFERVIAESRSSQLRSAAFPVLASLIAEHPEHYQTSEAHKRLVLFGEQSDAPLNFNVMAIFALAKAQSWHAASKLSGQLTKRWPEDSWNWIIPAPLMILAADEDAYRQHCRSMAERFANTQDYTEAERLCKVSCLSPHADRTNLPLAVLAQALDEGNTTVDFTAWGWSTRALVAWRNGDAKAAQTYVDNAIKYQPNPYAHALILATRVLVLLDLGDAQKANVALESATQAVQKLPTGEAGWYHDLLIARVILREAELRIAEQKTAQREAAGE
jgi:serine/threonine protein kinase/Tfp pilus assembly protein PilF